MSAKLITGRGRRKEEKKIERNERDKVGYPANKAAKEKRSDSKVKGKKEGKKEKKDNGKKEKSDENTLKVKLTWRKK